MRLLPVGCVKYPMSWTGEHAVNVGLGRMIRPNFGKSMLHAWLKPQTRGQEVLEAALLAARPLCLLALAASLHRSVLSSALLC